MVATPDKLTPNQTRKLTYILIGCDDNGIHTEAFIAAWSMTDACIAFAHRDVGPISFLEITRGMHDAEDVSSDDLRILERAEDEGVVFVEDIDRYKELVELVNDRIVDIASGVFNFGQFASDDDYDGKKYKNYVDGDSVSQWQIYQIDPTAIPGGPSVKVYPKSSNRDRV